MKFLVDKALSPQSAFWIGEQGLDAMHARDTEFNRAPDTHIVRIARDEGRIVGTADLDLLRLWALTRAEKTGLILFRGGNCSEAEAIERLDRTLELAPARYMGSSIMAVEKNRIRGRSLPMGRWDLDYKPATTSNACSASTRTSFGGGTASPLPASNALPLAKSRRLTQRQPSLRAPSVPMGLQK